jgi:hypothetical protein
MSLFTPDDYPEYISIMLNDAILNGVIEDTNYDQEIWTIARESEDIPHIGNIKFNVMAEKIKNGLAKIFNKEDDNDFITYSANSLCSYIYFDNEEYNDYYELVDAIESKLKEEDYYE